MTALLVAMLLSQDLSLPKAPESLDGLTVAQLSDEWQRLDDLTPRIGGEIAGIVTGSVGFFFAGIMTAFAINERFRFRFPFEGPPDDSMLGFAVTWALSSAACVLISTYLLTIFLPERREIEAEANRVKARLVELQVWQPDAHPLDRL